MAVSWWHALAISPPLQHGQVQPSPQVHAPPEQHLHPSTQLQVQFSHEQASPQQQPAPRAGELEDAVNEAPPIRSSEAAHREATRVVIGVSP